MFLHDIYFLFRVQMKITLIFFVSCLLVAITLGQNIFYGPFAPFNSGRHALPSGRNSGGRNWPSYYQKYENNPPESVHQIVFIPNLSTCSPKAFSIK